MLDGGGKPPYAVDSTKEAGMEHVAAFFSEAAGFVWGWPLILLLFGTHLFLTVRTGFIQRFLPQAIRLSFSGKREGEGDISHFGALMTALAATIGTGNIYGVAGAVLLGGPGAVLWMWLTGVFGIATKYSEAVLSVKFRVANAAGQMAGGPMYVLERGLGWKWAGVLFAAFTALAGLGIGNMNQANAISEMVVAQFGAGAPTESVDALKLGVAVLLTVMTAAVILGGIRSIASVCAIFVPFMALFYGFGCLVILVMNAAKLPGTVELIVSSAFTGHAAVGGFAGAAIKEVMRYGIARGLFSNEAGLGSAPIVAAAAQTRNAVRQALVSSTGVFWDTVVVCALTGLVVVTCGDWTSPEISETKNKAALCASAFGHLGLFGKVILTGGLMTFVFSTILGWAYYGEKAIEYLFGLKAVPVYRWIWVAAVFVGANAKIGVIWDFADVMNGLMAVPNLVSLILLSHVIVAETREHIGDLKKL